MFKKIGVSALLAALLSTGALAQAGLGSAPATPDGQVRALYGAYLGADAMGRDILDKALYSARMDRKIDSFEARCKAEGEEESCGPDFDFFIAGQDFEIRQFNVVAGRPAKGARKTPVTASFRNSGTPVQLRFGMIREGGRWVIDSLDCLVGCGDERWTLDQLLMQ
jgi:hypothetical protein